MSHLPSRQPDESKNPDQLRREAVEILQRHRRGLPGQRGQAAPPPVAAPLGVAHKSLTDGRALLDSNQLAEALLRADKAIGLAPSGSPQLVDGWTLRGDICLQQGSHQAARDAFRRALELNPAHIGARVGLAESFRQRGHYARAIPLLVETVPLSTHPETRTRLRLLLAECYLANGQPEAAHRVLRTVERGQVLSHREKLRVAATLLAPGDGVAWLLLLLAIATVVALSISANTLAALVALLVSLFSYAAFQWWRAPVRQPSDASRQ